MIGSNQDHGRLLHAKSAGECDKDCKKKKILMFEKGQISDLLQSQTHAVVFTLTNNQIQTNSLPRILDLSEVINIIQRNPHVIGLQLSNKSQC